MKIKQIIVVEGKTDTMKLKQVFNNEVDTIETNGLSIDKHILKLIHDANKSRGVIIFTDPDGPGLKIREKINSYLDFKCLNAFINKKFIKNSKKIGIAEAEPKDIENALNNIIIFKGTDEVFISWEDFLINNFYLKENRVKIAEHFNWSEKINVKTFFKWINYTGLTIKDLKEILED